MKKIIGILLLYVSVAHAQSWQGSGQIKFYGTSTLHDFEGKVETKKFAVNPNSNVVIHVVVEKMTTDNKKRDKNMREILEEEKHPDIRAEIDTAAWQMFLQEEKKRKLPLTLTIRDISKPITADISGWRIFEDRTLFVASFDVSLSDFELDAPSVLGLITVGDIVKIKVDVRLISTPDST